MKKSNLFRFLLLVLALSTVLACFVGCNNNSKTPDDGTTESKEDETDPETPTDETTESNEPTLDVPTTLDYNNTTIEVLAWSAGTDFSHEIKDAAGNEINEAIVQRDANIEDRLGVKLNYTPIAAGAADVKTFKAFVQQAHEGGTYYDIVAAYTRCNAVCASAGYFLDFNSIADSYIETEDPWWNHDIVEKTSIGDSVFMITGDASAKLVQMVYCIYFNADLLEDRGLESPYDLVADNKWTYDKMLSMGKEFYQDLNDNKQVDLEDMLPITGLYYDWPAFFHGCEINYSTKDDEGNIIIDPILVDEKAINLYQTVADSMTLDGVFVGKGVNCTSNFLAEKALFFITYSGRAAASFKDVAFEYGAVPMPKYDTQQEDYHGAVRQPISLFSIMKGVNVERHQMVSAVLEVWAYESYTTTTPVIFNQIMQYQKAASPEMTEMLELIRDTAYFDFIRIYSKDYGAGGADVIGTYLYNGNSWNDVTKDGGVYYIWRDKNDILMESIRNALNS